MKITNSERLKEVGCFLFDMDGTIYLGDRLLPGAAQVIEFLQRQRTPFYFLTNNSSRARGGYAAKLRRLGLNIGEDAIFTSGEATALHLVRTHPGARLLGVGTPSLEQEMVDHGFTLDAEEPDAVVLGFDTGLTYAKLWQLCNHIRAGLPYFATHPDFNCPTESGYMPDIGATIAFAKASTGREPNSIIGKPSRRSSGRSARWPALPWNGSSWWETGCTRTLRSAARGSPQFSFSLAKRRQRTSRGRHINPLFCYPALLNCWSCFDISLSPLRRVT